MNINRDRLDWGRGWTAMQEPQRTGRDWWVDQGQKLRAWRRACWRLSLVVIVLALLGLALIVIVPLPGLMVAVIGAAVAVAPLLLVVYWLMPVPDIWGVPAGWVAMATFLATLPLVLFGRYFAAQMLAGMFRESPALFPIAATVATYFGVLLAALAVIAVVAMLALMFLTGWTLLSGIVGWTGWRRFLRDAAIYMVIAVLIGWTLGSLGHLERIAQQAVFRVAIEADFHASHRCDMAGWPEGVSRVAFVGDEQVLAAIPPRDRIVVLPCPRVIGDPG